MVDTPHGGLRTAGSMRHLAWVAGAVTVSIVLIRRPALAWAA
jgi:hypothetical protein